MCTISVNADCGFILFFLCVYIPVCNMILLCLSHLVPRFSENSYYTYSTVYTYIYRVVHKNMREKIVRTVKTIILYMIDIIYVCSYIIWV